MRSKTSWNRIDTRHITMRWLRVGFTGAAATLLFIATQCVLGTQPSKDLDKDEGGVLSAYINAAMREAIFHTKDAHLIYAVIPGISAAWGRGATEAEALIQLRRSLEFVVLNAVYEREPLPGFSGHTLELIRGAESPGNRVLYQATDARKEDMLNAFDGFDE